MTKDITEKSKLTQKEEDLLETLQDPKVCGLPVTHICDAAKIDTSTYYRAFKKEAFVQRVHDECVGIIHSSILPIIHAAKNAAINDGKNAHHWARMLLEMSGLYIPKKEAQVKAEIKLIFNIPRPGEVEGKIIDVTPSGN